MVKLKKSPSLVGCLTGRSADNLIDETYNEPLRLSIARIELNVATN